MKDKGERALLTREWSMELSPEPVVGFKLAVGGPLRFRIIKSYFVPFGRNLKALLIQ